MNKIVFVFMTAMLLSAGNLMLSGQKKGFESITIPELKADVSFLASDELKGRNTGDEELLVAARYLATQAALIGLQPLDEDRDYYQDYSIIEKNYDFDRSSITITGPGGRSEEVREPFFLFPRRQINEVMLEGEVVFAGYGINSEDNGYNDFEGIDVEDKIVLIMNRAPMNEDGTEYRFDPELWGSRWTFQHKLPYIGKLKPRAVFLVYDPKSGINSIADASSRFVDYMSRSMDLYNEEESGSQPEGDLKVFIIHRDVADRLLEGTGHSLKALQEEIDRETSPKSFLIPGKHVKLDLRIHQNMIVVPNIFGYIEGSDPELKKEMIIYLAHFDHIGFDNSGNIYNGADDNATGTTALIEIAEAFMAEKKKPKRSIGFLWVSAEEKGLFGSEYYADHPLWDMDHTAAAINLDMIGRTKTELDVSDNPRETFTIVGGDSVKVIGGLQSKVLMKINKNSLAEMNMVGEYKYNDRNHPERYFYRSDHFNFVRKDVPVLFYSTGTHHDYHGPNDVPESLDYDKFLKMCRFAYKVGYNTANYSEEIVVDNPYSSW